jgi:hypothetical protein
MVKEISEVEELRKEGDVYIMDKHYIYELTEEECKKFKSDIEGKINTLKEEVTKCEGEAIILALQKVEEDLDNEYKIKQDAIINFKKYCKETIDKFKKNAEKEKADLFTFCQNIEDIKKQAVAKFKQQIERKKETYKSQLEWEQRLLKMYDNI